MGMRALASMQGAVFDVPAEKAESFTDIFEHAKESGKHMDFEISKCVTMPELYDVDRFNGPPAGGRGGYSQGGYSRGGYSRGGDSYGSGGRGMNGSSRGGPSRGGRGGGSRPRNQEASVFVGNLSYTATQDDIKRMFSGSGLNTVDVRVLQDDRGQSKGSAFVEFSSA